jgi:hypothetical protein
VKNQDEAIKVAKSMYEKEKIDAIMLCPGNSDNITTLLI